MSSDGAAGPYGPPPVNAATPGSGPKERHVVLVSPDVHWNTGNIGRTCLGAGAKLHLIRPLGFSLSDKHVKRAGLDYWQKVDVTVWDAFERFMDAARPRPDEIALYTKNGPAPHWDLKARPRMFLVFGSETGGLPEAVLSRFPGRRFCIPTSSEIRSLNLSTAVGIALYDTLRPRR